MKLVITMSRRYGTGASLIAEELSDRLGIPVYGKDYIEYDLGESAYEEEAEEILKLAGDPCIIVGRYACELLKNRKNVLNVYICADKEDRVRRVMHVYSLDEEEARQFIAENDKMRTDFYHKCTGKDWGDLNDYHLILNTSELGIENCADILMKYLDKCEFI